MTNNFDSMCHYLVNILFVTSCDNESVTVNEKKLPISRLKWEEIINDCKLDPRLLNNPND